ncbi:LytTR family DNA-binding domain-containing protein [Gemmobacter caeruleus]|uniref:LytTR family DNA-binding domain-containing protein n=1 Tax=Gemmobacter caeruleus TaxID=2595004 RepID=UPI0011EBF176|nr:LytTR family DNA-binding domain-containing protein [Gemmobacter caeruleus]
MAAFLSIIRTDFRNPLLYAAWAALSVLIAIAGPFGSYIVMPLPSRLLFWATTMGAGMMVGIVIRALLTGPLGLRNRQLVVLSLATLCAAIMTLPLHALLHRLVPLRLADEVSHGDVALFIFAISLVISAFRHGIAQGPGAVRALQPEVDQDPPDLERADLDLPRIVLRLEPALQGRLIAMTVRDHYVDVHTTEGKGSVLIRFADAIAEAEGEGGAQIHRSHWVAWWAVKGIERDAGKLWVRLCPELRLPVSKTHRDKLEGRDFEVQAAE